MSEQTEIEQIETLEGKSNYVLGLLKQYEPVKIEEMDMNFHYLPPHIPKETWNNLGKCVSSNEKNIPVNQIDGSKWMSFRLDGNGFSNTIKKINRNGVFEGGFSELFADIMKKCTLKLMEKMGGSIGFTQSDEIVIFVPPANITNGVQQQHIHNGRTTKLSTLAAGLVSSIFTLSIAKICNNKNISLEVMLNTVTCFDCRMAQYNTWEEAQALLMWRAYDCSINGISDAVHQTKGQELSCPKEIRNSNKLDKLKWLKDNNFLPLHPHQAYGAFYSRVKRRHEGINPKTNKVTVSLRNRIELIEMPVTEIIRNDLVFQTNDTS